jgi:putative alpha-1,2-mannosidase
MYAYDDWALSVVAAAAGKADVHDAFVARSKNYRCVDTSGLRLRM